jgi:hypothetical protein
MRRYTDRDTDKYSGIQLMKPTYENFNNFYYRYNESQKALLKTYLNRGYEINSYIRSVNYDNENNPYIDIKQFDKCFKPLSQLNINGNILKTYRVMTKPFNPIYNKAYISTSTKGIPILDGFLYEVYIPFDAEVCIFNITGHCKDSINGIKEPVYEIVVKRNSFIRTNDTSTEYSKVKKMLIVTKYILENPEIADTIL